MRQNLFVPNAAVKEHMFVFTFPEGIHSNLQGAVVKLLV